jgi:hypothetical protein
VIPPVIIQLAVAGVQDTERAFATLQTRVSQFEKAAEREGSRGARTRVKTAEQETADRARAAAKLAAQVERDEKRQTAIVEREAKARQRSADRTAQTVARETKRAADVEVREHARATREIERQEERKMRVRIRSSEMAGRVAVRQEQEEERRNSRVSRREGAFFGRQAGAVGRAAYGAILGAGAATVGIGGYALVDNARRQMAAERSAALLVNQVTVGGAPPEGANVGAIMGQASQVARETGMDKASIIEGTRAYAKTARGGDYRGAMANMGFFAKMATTTGVDMSEIAGAAGMLQSQNPELAADPGKMRQMLLDMYAQTKAGSLGLTEMIGQAGKMGSVRGVFAGSQTVNQAKLMALGQLVAPAAGDESGIMIKDFALEIMKGKHQDIARSMGVKFDKLNRMESPEQMIGAVMRSTGGDIKRIDEVFGGVRGSTVLREMAPGYAAAKAAGGQAGADKYLEDLIGSVTKATMSVADLDAQFKQIQSTSGAELSVAFSNIEEQLAKDVGPALDHFAKDSLPQLMPFISGFAEALGDLAKFIGSMTGTGSKGGTAEVLEGANLEAKIKAGTATPEERAQAEQLAAKLAKGAGETDSPMNTVAKWMRMGQGVATIAAQNLTGQFGAAEGTAAKTKEDVDAISKAWADLAKNMRDASASIVAALAGSKPGGGTGGNTVPPSGGKQNLPIVNRPF